MYTKGSKEKQHNRLCEEKGSEAIQEFRSKGVCFGTGYQSRPMGYLYWGYRELRKKNKQLQTTKERKSGYKVHKEKIDEVTRQEKTKKKGMKK